MSSSRQHNHGQWSRSTAEPSPRVEQTDMQDQEPPDIRSHVFSDDMEWSIKRAFNGSKIMNTQIKKIIRKQNKESSKELMGCKEKFELGFNESKEAIKEILNAFTSEQVSGGQVRRATSRSGASWKKTKIKERPEIPLECMWCIKKDKTIEEFNKKLKQNEETLKQVFHMRDKLEEQIQRLNRDMENQTAELNQRLRTEKEKNRRLEEQIALLKQQCQTERDMKDDALRRLSAMASSKLRDNNPNITDLSDQNRPTKIAEKLSELYDNQWTDAFDALQKDRKQDETIIQELLKMLMDVFNECSRLAKDRFFEKVQDSIEFPVERKVRNRPVELPDQLKQQMKEFRRVRATKVIREIQEVVLENLGLVNQPNDIQSYLAHCVEIGWLAAVQDPPLALMGKSPDRFDTNVFKDYTQRGPYVEYVVWPALLLHENGPMLAKGVAQGCSVKPMSSLQNLNPNPPAKRQNTDATDGGSSTPKKAVVSLQERSTGNGAQFTKTISASGTHITKVYTRLPNPTPKESDF